jgi:hypothetical protein
VDYEQVNVATSSSPRVVPSDQQPIVTTTTNAATSTTATTHLVADGEDNIPEVRSVIDFAVAATVHSLRHQQQQQQEQQQQSIATANESVPRESDANVLPPTRAGSFSPRLHDGVGSEAQSNQDNPPPETSTSITNTNQATSLLNLQAQQQQHRQQRADLESDTSNCTIPSSHVRQPDTRPIALGQTGRDELDNHPSDPATYTDALPPTVVMNEYWQQQQQHQQRQHVVVDELEGANDDDDDDEASQEGQEDCPMDDTVDAGDEIFYQHLMRPGLSQGHEAHIEEEEFNGRNWEVAKAQLANLVSTMKKLSQRECLALGQMSDFLLDPESKVSCFNANWYRNWGWQV